MIRTAISTTAAVLYAMYIAPRIAATISTSAGGKLGSGTAQAVHTTVQLGGAVAVAIITSKLVGGAA